MFSLFATIRSLSGIALLLDQGKCSILTLLHGEAEFRELNFSVFQGTKRRAEDKGRTSCPLLTLACILCLALLNISASTMHLSRISSQLFRGNNGELGNGRKF